MNTNTTNVSACLEVSVPFPVFFTIGVVSLLENLLVLVAVICNRNLHSPMYCFICSLAAFNTIASLTKTFENVMIVFADFGQLERKGNFEKMLDDVMDLLLCMSLVGSIFSFLAISMDRYITIFYALRYHQIMTMRCTGTILGAIWTTSGVLAGLMICFSDYKFILICFALFFVISLMILCLLYVYMFMLARIHAKRMASLSTGQSERCQRRQRWGSNMRGAMTLTILFGAFIVCWGPFSFHLIIMSICPTNPYCECYRTLFQLHVVLLMSHALIDPAIYAYRSVELRHTFRKMLIWSK